MYVRQTKNNHPWLTSTCLSPEPSEQDISSAEDKVQTKKTQRILVVDDSKDARESMASLLRELGYEVDTAGDGTSAFERALQFRPYAMLIDIIMPGRNGFELAGQIRAQPQLCDTLLITLTGWDHNMDPWLAQHAGADYHLSKPIDVGLLGTYLEKGRQEINSV